MKRFFRTLAFLAVATISVASMSSCKEEDDDNKNNSKFVLDPNRASGGAVENMSGAKSDEFYKGLTNVNNVGHTIVIDTRSASEYKAGHVTGAYSKPLTNDDAFYYDDDPIYLFVEEKDPNHENFILLTDNGASPMMLHVAGRIAAMGWGKTKVYLLMDKTSDFLNKYPDVKE